MDTVERPHKRAVSLRELLRDMSIPKDIIVKTPDEFERYDNAVGTIVFPAAHDGKVLYEEAHKLQVIKSWIEYMAADRNRLSFPQPRT